MSKVYLFVGIESQQQQWKLQDFDKVINFCKQHNIDGIILKVYEFVQGDWYQYLGGSEIVVNYIQKSGIECLPYGFFYGGMHWNQEAGDLKKLFSNYNRFCLNLESDWNNNANDSIDALVMLLREYPTTEIWVSTWANPVDQGWIENIQKLDKYVDKWMPEEYSDDLIQRRLNQFPHTMGAMYPTYKVASETIENIAISEVPSLWEYQIGLENPQWIDDFVSHIKGGMQSMSLVLNSSGMVLDVPFFYQLEPGESEDLCGNFGAAILSYAGLPNKGSRGTGEQVDQLADKLANDWNSGVANELGSTKEDMYNYLTHCFDDKGNRTLHFQEINPTKDRIDRALRCGYPVLVTVNEQNVKSIKTSQQPPYPWNLNANHIFPLMHVSDDGKAYTVADYLNNKFQGEWPCHYDATILQPSWACVIQVVGPDATKPWLAPIPGVDPLTWPQNFNAQLFAQGGTTTTQVSGQDQQNIDTFNASNQFLQAIGLGIDLNNDPVAQEWKTKYQPKFDFGPPLFRYDTVDWNTQPITITRFLSGQCQRSSNGKTRWWYLGREVTF